MWEKVSRYNKFFLNSADTAFKHSVNKTLLVKHIPLRMVSGYHGNYGNHDYHRQLDMSTVIFYCMNVCNLYTLELHCTVYYIWARFEKL